MRRIPLYALILSVISFACSEPNRSQNDLSNEVPIIQLQETFEVIVSTDIQYAEGLSHNSINSTDAVSKPLYLDSYVPSNDSNNRPVLVLIHGGGFISGSKQQTALVNLANYFASRGWVVFSVDYRLRDDLGTVPKAWVDFSDKIDPEDVAQYFAIYPAHRDAKAALRWVIANAETYNINTDYITVGGGSAGAVTSIGISICDQEDYEDELSTSQDPTLLTTNLGQTYEVQTILDFWGSDISIEAIERIYGQQRFGENNPPLFIAHGTQDNTVLFSEAEQLRDIYESNDNPYVFYELTGKGHSAWDATVNGKRLEELAFQFVIDQQQLLVD